MNEAATDSATDGESPRTPLDGPRLAERLLTPGGPLAHLEVLAKVGSTNTELVRCTQDPKLGRAWVAPALLAADHQEAGRGRLDRAWQTPQGTALTSSLLLKPKVPASALPWLPLLTGLATARVVRRLTGVAAGLKWPNDILAAHPGGTDMLGWGHYRKLGGVLTEALPLSEGVVVGVGLNVDQREDELPVSSAISIRLAGGGRVDRTELLAACVRELCVVVTRWEDAGGDAEAAGLRAGVEELLVTVGHEIRAFVPGGREVRGRAVALGADGALIVHGAGGGEEIVLSGDVHHVRLADGA